MIEGMPESPSARSVKIGADERTGWSSERPRREGAPPRPVDVSVRHTVLRPSDRLRYSPGSLLLVTGAHAAGLDRFLKTLNLSLARSAVGDRYVLEEMAKGGFNVGGEQSGHIILSDFSTTGDGLIAALQVLAVLAQEGKSASDAAHLFEPLPQVLENVRFKKGSPLDDERVKSSIESANAKLGASGRILVRKSGTEPLIRVMAEGEDEKMVRAVVRQIASAIEEVAA